MWRRWTELRYPSIAICRHGLRDVASTPRPEASAAVGGGCGAGHTWRTAAAAAERQATAHSTPERRRPHSLPLPGDAPLEAGPPVARTSASSRSTTSKLATTNAAATAFAAWYQKGELEAGLVGRVRGRGEGGGRFQRADLHYKERLF